MELETYEHNLELLTTVASVVNGGVAGMTGVLTTFPIDLTKTRLQNQSNENGKKLYSGMIDCFKKVVKSEGFAGLYRGILPNLILILPEKAIKLTVNDVLRRQLSSDGRSISIQNQLLAGAGAGVCQVVVTAPMEVMKIYGQDAGRINALHSSGGHRKNSFLVVYERYGISGFYRGVFATLLRDVPFSMIYFPLFAKLNRFGMKDSDSTRSPFIVSLLSAATAGAVAAAAVNPVDVVKTRLQSVHRATDNYTGVVDCFRRMYKEEGVRSFFRGVQPRVLAIAPLFGIAQSVYFLGVGQAVLGIPQVRAI